MWPFVLALQLGGVDSQQLSDPRDPTAEPSVAASPLPPQSRPLASGFGRAQLGIGPPAFSSETGLLRLEGYSGGKLWVEIDGGYMSSVADRHVGGGLWAAVAHWYSPGSTSAPALHETAYLIGLEIPLRFGTRDLALLAAPRIGVAKGSLTLGGEAPSQAGFVWGAQASAVSSRYHLSASVSFLSAAIEPPNTVGRPHDLGGLYFSLGALLDDG